MCRRPKNNTKLIQQHTTACLQFSLWCQRLPPTSPHPTLEFSSLKFQPKWIAIDRLNTTADSWSLRLEAPQRLDVLGYVDRSNGNNKLFSVSATWRTPDTNFNLLLVFLRSTIPVHYVGTNSRTGSCVVLNKLNKIKIKSCGDTGKKTKLTYCVGRSMLATLSSALTLSIPNVTTRFYVNSS